MLQFVARGWTGLVTVHRFTDRLHVSLVGRVRVMIDERSPRKSGAGLPLEEENENTSHPRLAKNDWNSKENEQLNHVWANDFYGEKNGAIIKKVEKIIKTAPYNAGVGDLWFDESDSQSDYFHTAFYMSIHIGQWDKPYQVVWNPYGSTVTERWK